jgi:hypothetical protein
MPRKQVRSIVAGILTAVAFGACSLLFLSMGNPTLSPLLSALVLFLPITAIIGGVTGLASSHVHNNRVILAISVVIGLVVGSVLTLFASQTLGLEVSQARNWDGYILLGLLIVFSIALSLFLSLSLSAATAWVTAWRRRYNR